MMSKSKVPQIRFNGFCEDWQETKLGEIGKFNPKAELPETFEYVDLESVSGTRMIAHRTENKITSPSRAQRLANNGDIFYQMVRPYQKNNCLFNLTYKNYVFSTGYAQIRPYSSSYFIFSYIQKNSFVKIVLDNCTGTSYPAINSKDLANIGIHYPKQDEQTKIGNYFQQLDKLIEEKEKKHQKLKQFKKAMLDKMFAKNGANTPEVRFEDFSGEWEEKKLEDITTYIKGFAFKSIDYRSQGTRIIRVSDLTKNSISESNNIYIDKIKAKEFDNYIIKFGDIIITTVGSKAELKESAVGRAIIFNKKDNYLLNQNLVKITPILNFESNFIYTQLLFKRYSKYIENIQRGNANQANIAISDLWNYLLQCPKYEEQKKIGNYFQTLDKQIDLQNKEIEKLKNIKKASLDKMFV